MKTYPGKLVVLVLVSGLCWLSRTQGQEDRHGVFVPVQPRAHAPRVLHTQTTLPNGRVLLAGGFQNLSRPLPLGNKDIEVFDPATGGFRVVAVMPTIRAMHTATELDDGRVLFIGGTVSTAVEAFDPRTSRVTAVGNILTARAEHAATLLSDGKVLITGGIGAYLRYRGGDFEPEFKVIRVTEVFDPRTGKSQELRTRMVIGRCGHTQTLLADGTVLIVGGDWSGTCLVLNPKTGEVRNVARLSRPREDHQATRLADGRVLITGGSAHGRTLDTAEIYDPDEQRLVQLESRMSAVREDHTATLLADGRVLLTGGENNQAGPDKSDIVLSSADIFDPEQNLFSGLEGLNVARDDHRATRLADGRVLIFGGQTSTGEISDTGELFVP